MTINKKELGKKYAQTIQPMGVYQVKNLINGKIFIDSGLNLRGKINGCKFQLDNGSHFNKELQNDYKLGGADNFIFEIIDHLEAKDDPQVNYAEDLKILEKIYIDKFQPFDDKGYNIPEIKK